MPRCSRCGKNPVVKCDDALSRAYCVHAIKPADTEPTGADINQAREEGKQADERKPPYCPLRQNAQYHAWLKGWMIAHADDPFTVARRRDHNG